MQFPSWDRDRREFVPTPLVDLTDGRAENDDGRNRVRASWGLSDAEAMREWLSRFSLGFEGDPELAAERPLMLSASRFAGDNALARKKVDLVLVAIPDCRE